MGGSQPNNDIMRGYDKGSRSRGVESCRNTDIGMTTGRGNHGNPRGRHTYGGGTPRTANIGNPKGMETRTWSMWTV